MKPKSIYLVPYSKNDEVNLLHSLRARMIDVKANFKTKYNDLNCPLCSSATDDQPHLLKNKMKSKEAALDYVEYEDITLVCFTSKNPLRSMVLIAVSRVMESTMLPKPSPTLLIAPLLDLHPPSEIFQDMQKYLLKNAHKKVY